MFIKRKEFEQLKTDFSSLQKDVRAVEEQVGLTHWITFGFSKTKQSKPFTLQQKVNAILEHLGLQENIEPKLIEKEDEKE